MLKKYRMPSIPLSICRIILYLATGYVVGGLVWYLQLAEQLSYPVVALCGVCTAIECLEIIRLYKLRKERKHVAKLKQEYTEFCDEFKQADNMAFWLYDEVMSTMRNAGYTQAYNRLMSYLKENPLHFELDVQMRGHLKHYWERIQADFGANYVPELDMYETGPEDDDEYDEVYRVHWRHTSYKIKEGRPAQL